MKERGYGILFDAPNCALDICLSTDTYNQWTRTIEDWLEDGDCFRSLPLTKGDGFPPEGKIYLAQAVVFFWKWEEEEENIMRGVLSFEIQKDPLPFLQIHLDARGRRALKEALGGLSPGQKVILKSKTEGGVLSSPEEKMGKDNISLRCVSWEVKAS